MQRRPPKPQKEMEQEPTAPSRASTADQNTKPSNRPLVRKVHIERPFVREVAGIPDYVKRIYARTCDIAFQRVPANSIDKPLKRPLVRKVRFEKSLPRDVASQRGPGNPINKTSKRPLVRSVRSKQALVRDVAGLQWHAERSYTTNFDAARQGISENSIDKPPPSTAPARKPFQITYERSNASGWKKLYSASTKRVDSSQQVDRLRSAGPRMSKLRGEVKFQYDGIRHLKVFVRSNEKSNLDVAFLRDSCPCPRCVDPSTGQKLFNTADIPLNIRPRKVHWDEARDIVHLTWENDIEGYDSHETQIHWGFVLRYIARPKLAQHRHEITRSFLWDRAIMERKVHWVEYEEYMTQEWALYQALLQLREYGLLFVKNVPEEVDSVERIGRRIGPLMNTLYGMTWDVRSVPNPTNIAYTHQELGLHQDLLYFDSPPALQLLHCMKNSATGGESIFADAVRAAHLLRDTENELFRAVRTFPVSYQYRRKVAQPKKKQTKEGLEEGMDIVDIKQTKEGWKERIAVVDIEHYHRIRPLIEIAQHPLDHPVIPRITSLNWSPPFQAPYEYSFGRQTELTERFESYLKAIQILNRTLNDPASIFELRLEPGQCVIMNNRRIVHGRKAFDVEHGERWLRGAYLGVDAFDSAWRVMASKALWGRLDGGKKSIGGNER